MDFLIIGIILLIIIIGAIIYTILKSVMKTIVLSISILLVALAIVVGIVYLDALNLQTKFINDDKTMLFLYEGNIISGAKGKFLDENQIPQLYTDSEVENINSLYQQKEFESLKLESYKLIIIDFKVFENISEINLVEDIKLNNIEIKEALNSKETRRNLITKDLEKKNNVKISELTGQRLEEFNNEIKEGLDSLSESNIRDDSQLKGAIIMSLMQKKSELENGTGWLIKEFKNKNVIIYPESPVFIAAKYLPDSMLIQMS